MTEDPGHAAAHLLDRLAALSEPGPGVTRLPFTAEHARAAALIEERMRRAKLETRRDAAGTIIGRRPGAQPDAPVFLLGSHQDSVRSGGAFDGIMGVVLPILAVEALGDASLPFAIEILAFADEEGVRFPTALLGPRALAGTLDTAVLDMTDRNGRRLRDALTEFGGDPEALTGLARNPSEIVGYLETHIEQGPVLEAEDLPVGIVTAIAGIERHEVRITGRAAHAGTTPMEMRQDALCAAAEIALAVERICTETPDSVGTVGQFDIAPNVVNAVPARVDCTVELRSSTDEVRAAVRDKAEAAARAAVERRRCGLEMTRTYEQPAKACDAALQDRLVAAIEAAGTRPFRLMSGATHDASAIADLCPMAMLFVRCRDGISHHPDEYARPEDMACAIEVISRFLLAQGDAEAATA